MIQRLNVRLEFILTPSSPQRVENAFSLWNRKLAFTFSFFISPSSAPHELKDRRESTKRRESFELLLPELSIQCAFSPLLSKLFTLYRWEFLRIC